jgi:hypothetical protein
MLNVVVASVIAPKKSFIGLAPGPRSSFWRFRAGSRATLRSGYEGNRSQGLQRAEKD